MTISMYAASVPVFVRMLRNLDGILDKAAANAAARKFDPNLLLEQRLAIDMLPLKRQVQIASDFAKGASARLAGVEPPKYEDNEATLADLKARIAKTLAFLETLRPAQFEGSESRDIKLAMRDRTLEFAGLPYLLEFVLPNFYFHVTTTYAILRHLGVEIGKRDFVGGP